MAINNENIDGGDVMIILQIMTIVKGSERIPILVLDKGLPVHCNTYSGQTFALFQYRFDKSAMFCYEYTSHLFYPSHTDLHVSLFLNNLIEISWLAVQTLILSSSDKQYSKLGGEE